MSETTPIKIVRDLLVGRKLISLTHSSHVWTFAFVGRCILHVECHWRVVADGRVVVADEDDGQPFGTGVPTDVAAVATRHLSGEVARLGDRTVIADLALAFSGGGCLELWSNSRAYEQWTLWMEGTFQVAGLGGGALTTQ